MPPPSTTVYVSTVVIITAVVVIVNLLTTVTDVAVDGVELDEIRDIKHDLKKTSSSADALANLEDMIAGLDIKLSQLASAPDATASLAAVTARLNLIGAQIQALGSAVSAQTVTNAPTADDARNMVRDAVATYSAGVASGAISPPSASDLLRLEKLVLAAIDTGELPDPSVEVGSLVSDYQQQATGGGGSSSKRAPSSLVTVPADYDVDYDNDGEPDFAVVHLSPEMVLPPLPYTPWDIPVGTQIIFEALPNGDSYTMTRNSGVSLLSTAGHARILDFTDFDDGFTTRDLAHGFSFNHTVWTSLFVNTDGALTFSGSSADSSNRGLGRFFQMPPVISAMFMDLDISCNPASGVYFKSDATSSVFTWLNVVHFDREARFGCAAAQAFTSTFQMILYATGSIEFRYGVIDSGSISVVGRTNSVGFTGIGHGSGYMVPVNYVDFSSFPSPQTVTIGSAVQAWNFASVRNNILRDNALTKFYLTHPKNYDTVMAMYYGWGSRILQEVSGSLSAHSVFYIQSTSGLGRSVVPTSIFGAEMEQFVSMRNLEAVAGLTAEQQLEPTVQPISTAGGWYQAKDFFNRTSFTGATFAPTFPYAMSVVDKGLSSGYSYETVRKYTGALQQQPEAGALYTDFQTTAHELSHRWNAFHGYRYPDPSQWGANFRKLISTDQAHPNPFIDLRVNTDPATSPWSDTDAKFAPKRPRGDVMPYSSGHMTQLIPNPVGDGSFVDAMDASIVYPDTPKFNISIAYELCRSLGKDLWIHTPQALYGSLSVKTLAFSGIISYRDVLNKTMFYVENPVSPYAAFGFTTDLSTLAPIIPTLTNNMMSCGTKRTFTIAEIFNTSDVRRSPQVQAVLGSISATNAARTFGPREPLIGDEGDTIDPAVDAAYPNARHRYNLDACPIVNDPLCNSPALTPGKSNAICVDIKTVAPVIFVRPGQTLPNNAINDFALWLQNRRENYAHYILSDHGARGKVGDTCYLPKYNFGLVQVVH